MVDWGLLADLRVFFPFSAVTNPFPPFRPANTPGNCLWTSQRILRSETLRSETGQRWGGCRTLWGLHRQTVCATDPSPGRAPANPWGIPAQRVPTVFPLPLGPLPLTRAIRNVSCPGVNDASMPTRFVLATVLQQRTLLVATIATNRP